MASSAPVLLSTADGGATVPTYPATIYSTPSLATQAAKTAKNTKATQTVLGTPTPAGHKVVKKKHKVDFLAGISESVTKNVEHQFSALPSNVNKLLKRIGVTGSS